MPSYKVKILTLAGVVIAGTVSVPAVVAYADSQTFALTEQSQVDVTSQATATIQTSPTSVPTPSPLPSLGSLESRENLVQTVVSSRAHSTGQGETSANSSGNVSVSLPSTGSTTGQVKGTLQVYVSAAVGSSRSGDTGTSSGGGTPGGGTQSGTGTLGHGTSSTQAGPPAGTLTSGSVQGSTVSTPGWSAEMLPHTGSNDPLYLALGGLTTLAGALWWRRSRRIGSPV